MEANLRRVRPLAIVLGALALLLALGASLASAEELNREEWVAKVEPICKANVLANQKIFKGAKEEVKAGELKKASTHFSRAAAAFAKTIKQIEAVPQPSADQAKIAKWLGYLRGETTFVQNVGKALAAEQRRKAESISVDLNRNSTRANNAALGFDFDYCRIVPARFG
jgi:hypothetical protein